MFTKEILNGKFYFLCIVIDSSPPCSFKILVYQILLESPVNYICFLPFKSTHVTESGKIAFEYQQNQLLLQNNITIATMGLVKKKSKQNDLQQTLKSPISTMRKVTKCVFGCVFQCIRTEFEDLQSKSLHSVRLRENTD